MTRKHFQAIAAAIKSSRVNNSFDNANRALYNNGVDNVAENIANTLTQFNPLFDKAKFIEACKA